LRTGAVVSVKSLDLVLLMYPSGASPMFMVGRLRLASFEAHVQALNGVGQCAY
jgi:hypothetical protein